MKRILAVVVMVFILFCATAIGEEQSSSGLYDLTQPVRLYVPEIKAHIDCNAIDYCEILALFGDTTQFDLTQINTAFASINDFCLQQAKMVAEEQSLHAWLVIQPIEIAMYTAQIASQPGVITKAMWNKYPELIMQFFENENAEKAEYYTAPDGTMYGIVRFTIDESEPVNAAILVTGFDGKLVTFSFIGYTATKQNLDRTIRNFLEGVTYDE